MGKTRSHKLIALILSVAMVLSVFAVFPLGAAADGTDTQAPATTDDGHPSNELWTAFVNLVNNCESAEVQTLAKNSGNNQAEAFADALKEAQAIVAGLQSSATTNAVNAAKSKLEEKKAALKDVKVAKDAWVAAVEYVGGTIKYKDGYIDADETMKTINATAGTTGYTNANYKWTVASFANFVSVLTANKSVITDGALGDWPTAQQKADAIKAHYIPREDEITGAKDYTKCTLIPADALVEALKATSNADGDMVGKDDGYVESNDENSAYNAYKTAYGNVKDAVENLKVDSTTDITNGQKAVDKAKELAGKLRAAFANLDLLVDEWKGATTIAYKDLLAKLAEGNNKYTAYGWSQFEAAITGENGITAAYKKGPLAVDSTTDKELQAAIAKALSDLEAYDLSPLAALIEQAEGLKTNDKDLAAALKTALKDAKDYDNEAYVVSTGYTRKITSAVADSNNGNKLGVATTLAGVIAKITATKTDLQELVEVAKNILGENENQSTPLEYTAQTWKALKDAKTYAQKVIDAGANALPSAIAKATTDLQAAIDGLISLKELNEALDLAEAAQKATEATNKINGDYDASGLTQAQINALNNAITAAKTTRNAASVASNTVTVKEIATDTEDLLNAYNAVKKVALTGASTKAKADVAADFAKLNAADYTALDYAEIKAAAEAVAAADVNSIVEKTKEDFDNLVTTASTKKQTITASLKKINDYVAAINAKIAAKGAAYNANSAQAKDIAAYVKAIEAYVTKATTVADATKGGVVGSTFNNKVNTIATADNLTNIDKLIEVVVNESEYLAAKAQADALVESDYTAATWKVLQEQLKNAAEVYGKDSETTTNNISKVDGVTKDDLKENQKVDNTASILAAIKNLKAVAADKTELNALLEQAAALKADDYTAESWAKLEAAVAQGNAAALKSEVAAAVAALKEALPGLVKVDRSALEVLVEQAKALKADDYTAESYAKVTEALAQAEAAKTQEEVDAAVAALKAAIAGLEKAPVEELPVLKLLNKCPASYKLSLSKEGTNYTHIKTTWDKIEGVKIEYAWYSTNSSIVKASTADIDGNGVACDIVTEGVKAGSATCICVVKATLPDGTTATAAHAMTIKVVK